MSDPPARTMRLRRFAHRRRRALSLDRYIATMLAAISDVLLAVFQRARLAQAASHELTQTCSIGQLRRRDSGRRSCGRRWRRPRPGRRSCRASPRAPRPREIGAAGARRSRRRCTPVRWRARAARRCQAGAGRAAELKPARLVPVWELVWRPGFEHRVAARRVGVVVDREHLGAARLPHDERANTLSRRAARAQLSRQTSTSACR